MSSSSVQPSSFPGTPVLQPQSISPGAPGFPPTEHHSSPGLPGQAGSPPPQPGFDHTAAPLHTPPVYGQQPSSPPAAASSYYNNHPQAASPGAYPGGPVQYDMNGRPVGPGGGKDYGAMAMGALSGLAKKKMMGGSHGHHGGKHSSGSHALMAEGAKMLYGMYKDNNNKTHGGQGQHGYGPPQGYQQQPQYGGHASPPAQHGSQYGANPYGSSPGAGMMGSFGKREA